MARFTVTHIRSELGVLQKKAGSGFPSFLSAVLQSNIKSPEAVVNMQACTFNNY